MPRRVVLEIRNVWRHSGSQTEKSGAAGLSEFYPIANGQRALRDLIFSELSTIRAWVTSSQ